MKKTHLMIAGAVLFLGMAVSALGQTPFVKQHITLSGQNATDSMFVLGPSSADTSETINSAIWWDNLVTSYQADCNCGEDSIDFALWYEGTLDGTNWFILDSVVVSDSNWAFDQVLTTTSLPPFIQFRAIYNGRAGIQEDTSAAGAIIDTTWLFLDVMAKGAKP